MPKKATGRPFQKGVSGNPSGRPKVPAEVRELAREATPSALKTLIEIHENKQQPAAARVVAANSIWDRAYGKPTQELEIKRPLGDLTDNELAAAIEYLRSAIAGTASGTGSGSKEEGSGKPDSRVSTVH